MRKNLIKTATLIAAAFVTVSAALTVSDKIPVMGNVSDAATVQALNAGNSVATGVDVSKYQGNVNWAQVRNSGVSFAFVRVGSTTYGVDPYFAVNMAGATAAGLRTGVYIYSYATTPEQAAIEAGMVLNLIAPYQVSLPVVFDIESNAHKKMTPEQNAAVCNTFCSIIESAGYYPMVYSNTFFFTNKIGPIFYDKWVAQYGANCQIPDASIWQAMCNGSVPGIAGDVDIDYMIKDYSKIILANGFSDRGGYTYYYSNYKVVMNNFVKDGDFTYFMDPVGHKVVNTFYAVGDGMFYFDTNGHMLTGFQKLFGSTYYFGTDGRMAIGQVAVGDKNYLFMADGKMYTGWTSDGVHAYYYFPEDGHMAKGLQELSGKKYFFEDNGWMAIGYKEIGGLKYFFDADGTMHKGWLSDGVNMSYFAEDGHMLTGLNTIGKSTYYFDKDGHALKGVQAISGNNYYFDPVTAEQKTGIVADAAGLMYFDPATKIQVKGLATLPDGIRYFDEKTGVMKTGVQKINGIKYYFDPATGVLMCNAVVTGTDNKVYITGPDGSIIAQQ